MTPEDAAFLHLENEISAMHHLTVAVFAGPEPSRSEILDRLRERLVFVPRYRQRVVPTPFDAQRPSWYADPAFDLDYHVRSTGLSSTETDPLPSLVGRLLSQRLDRGKPLWELWIVSNVDDDKWAMISKVHHAMVDGVSGNDPLTLIADGSRAGSRRSATGEPRSLPSRPELLGRALLDTALNPTEQLRVLRHRVRPLRSAAERLLTIGRSRPLAAAVGTVGPHRRWNVADVSLDALRSLRAESEATTTDVILALTSMGVRAMLKSADAPVPPTIRALVPYLVGERAAGDGGVTALAADLPTGFDNVAAMIGNIAAQNVHRPLPATGARIDLTALPGFVAPTLTAAGLRTVARSGLARDRVDTVVVNSPGPRDVVTVLGRDLLEVTPAIPLTAQVRVGVGVMSYRGVVRFGVTGDRDSQAALAAMVEGIEAAATG